MNEHGDGRVLGSIEADGLTIRGALVGAARGREVTPQAPPSVPSSDW